MEETTFSLINSFESISDPRVDRTKLHKLIDIIVVAICSVVAGADSFDTIEIFATAHEQWFRRFLELPNGIPSHDTLNAFSQELIPKNFAQVLLDGPKNLLEYSLTKSSRLTGKQCVVPKELIRKNLPFMYCDDGRNGLPTKNRTTNY